MQRSVLTALAAMMGAATATAETISFQNGFNGYNGTVQIRMSSGLGVGSTGGSLWDPDFVMCKKWVPDVSEGSVVFWRFKDMIGTAAGQIPPNSTILSARLELRTCSNVTIPGLTPPLPHGTFVLSTGPVCLARMLVPVDETKLTLWRPWGVDPNTQNYYSIRSIVPAPANPPLIWALFGAEGPDYAGGDYDRPAGGFIDMTVYERTESADVTSIVQAWTSGADNFGMIMFCDKDDYWVFEGTGQDYHYPSDLTRRPKLVVNYNPARTKSLVYQQDTNGYTGCSVLRVGQDGISTPGAAIDPAGTFLDGGTGPTDPEYDLILKFDNIFGSGSGRIPSKATIVKAYLALTTPSESNSASANSSGPFTVHQMLRDVDWTGTNHPAKPFLWSEFTNADGPTQADGEIGPALSRAQAMTFNGRACFDVTSTIQAWRAGTPNYGLVIKPGTTDGWKVFTTTAGDPQIRPQLVVMTEVRVPDLNIDGYVNQTDFTMFTDCARGPAIAYPAGCTQADLDFDNDVDAGDFGIFQACYSGDQEATIDCRW
jgi:hypothetical protein